MFTITLVVTLMAITNLALGYGLAVYTQRSMQGSWVPSLPSRRPALAPAVPSPPATAIAATQDSVHEDAKDSSEQKAEPAQQVEEQLDTPPAPKAVSSPEPAAQSADVEPVAPKQESVVVEPAQLAEVPATPAVQPKASKPEIEEEVLAGLEAFREQLAKMGAQQEELGDDLTEPAADPIAAVEEEAAAAVG
jgi:hypothetical protein